MIKTVIFNEALNILLLYSIRHIHNDNERGNLLPTLHELLSLISSKTSFMCTSCGAMGGRREKNPSLEIFSIFLFADVLADAWSIKVCLAAHFLMSA